MPALTMSAGPDEIVVAVFTELAPGSSVTIALSDPAGTIVVDGVVSRQDARGTCIVFTEVPEEIRERLSDFGRRNSLLGDAAFPSFDDESSERVA
jgi:hypothetical protein